MTRLPVSNPLAVNQSLSLDEDLRHYVRNVLRMREGEKVVLFNGDGYDYQATVSVLSKKTVELDVLERVENNTESPLKITLLQGLAKGDRMDFVMQKATELGVTRIIPVITEYCAVKVTESFREKKTAHWQHVTNFAAAQSGRAVVPRVEVPMKLAEALTTLGECDVAWTLSPLGKSCAELNATQYKTAQCESKQNQTGQKVNHLGVFVGPEGGLSDTDLSLAREHGFIDVKFGARILRTETAALTALALAQTQFGDF